MTGAFIHFSPIFFAFLEELAVNNNRDWFANNKVRYQDEVVSPMVAFIATMAPRLRKISLHFVADPRANGGSMFRIYRDVRFSKDRRPYKEHASCHFRHEIRTRDVHTPGYYVHLAPNDVRIGGGIWLPPGAALGAIRNAIDEDRSGWKRVVTNKRLNETFGGIGGDGLVRPPRGYDADHPHIEDLKRKTFFAMRRVDRKIALTPGFLNEVTDTFHAATPLMKFLTKTLGQAF